MIIMWSDVLRKCNYCKNIINIEKENTVYNNQFYFHYDCFIEDKLSQSKRKITKEDRREVHITATLKGKELSQKSSKNALSYRAMISALEKISEEDVQALIRIHKEILKHLRDCRF
jgi:hypothetical protein